MLPPSIEVCCTKESYEIYKISVKCLYDFNYKAMLKSSLTFLHLLILSGSHCIKSSFIHYALEFTTAQDS